MYAVHHTGSRNLWSVGFDVRRMQQLQSLRGTPIERGGSPQASGRNLRGRLNHRNLLRTGACGAVASPSDVATTSV